MKGTIGVLGFFACGCLAGYFFGYGLEAQDISLYVLYALMLQVGINIGSNKELKEIIDNIRPANLVIPVCTIFGTLAFTAAASYFISKWNFFECMAVGSGFAYYSLSSILISQLKEPSIGLQAATELGTIALLANVFREMATLVLAPQINKHFGPRALISSAGVTSMDVLLPTISNCCGKGMIPIAIVHGIIVDLSVPILVSFFCSL